MIDGRFVQIEPTAPSPPSDGAPSPAAELPPAHFIAARPAEGWIATLALVAATAEPLPAGEWLARQVDRSRASFLLWSPEAAEMSVPPQADQLAGRPALHVRYRLSGRGADDCTRGAEVDTSDAEAERSPAEPDAASTPSTLVEHWTVLVEERRWLLVMELMVQPPAQWDRESEALELPFRTLELV